MASKEAANGATPVVKTGRSSSCFMYAAIMSLASLAILVISILLATVLFTGRAGPTSSAPWVLHMSGPHRPQCFTQGLEFVNRTMLLESCGLYGESKIQLQQVADPMSGAPTLIERTFTPEKHIFAEGLTVRNGLVYVLTWKEHKLFVLDIDSLMPRKILDYPLEGWGITYNADQQLFYASDGSDLLYHLTIDDSSVNMTKRVRVRFNGQPIHKLNELEYYNGFLYANVWYTPYIYRIQPATGEVTHVYDMTQLMDLDGDVLNGIAQIPGTTNRFWITGKWWHVYHIVELKT